MAGVGWGGMITFVAERSLLLNTCLMLCHCDVACTSVHGRCYGMAGVGWGGMSTFDDNAISHFWTSLERALSYVNHNEFATCSNGKCENARAVFNPPGCF